MKVNDAGKLLITEQDTTADLLYAAARLVEAVTVRLDMSHTTCECCGARRHENRTHMQAYNRITDTPQKLREVAYMLNYMQAVATATEENQS